MSAARIVICGGGLAGRMTAALLTKQLGVAARITLVDCEDASASDFFIGSVTSPSAYAFNLAAGVPEPRLVLDTNAAFSWGTRFAGWGAGRRSWMQCFHLPLPVINGVQLHHYLRRVGVQELEPFLVTAAAAQRGVFAHPLETGSGLLRRAEYGYQIDPATYPVPFTRAAQGPEFRVVRARIAEVTCGEQGISALRLSTGEVCSADLFVDCTGIRASLISQVSGEEVRGRRVRALMSAEPRDGAGEPCRTVTAHDFGWQSGTPLQGATLRLTVCHPEHAERALAAHGATPHQAGEFTIGWRRQPWVHNCVAIGHAAGVVEPLSPAPMILLQRDIERLLSLIPVAEGMAVERREFNRQAGEDHAHVQLFHQALLEAPPGAASRYWHEASAEPRDEKLARKIAMFEGRGVLVSYDHEPLNPEDWTILHYGMGRRPLRYDRVADREKEADIRSFLERLQGEIATLAKSLPSQDDYLKGLIRYLRNSNW